MLDRNNKELLTIDNKQWRVETTGFDGFVFRNHTRGHVDSETHIKQLIQDVYYIGKCPQRDLWEVWPP